MQTKRTANLCCSAMRRRKEEISASWVSGKRLRRGVRPSQIVLTKSGFFIAGPAKGWAGASECHFSVRLGIALCLDWVSPKRIREALTREVTGARLGRRRVRGRAKGSVRGRWYPK